MSNLETIYIGGGSTVLEELFSQRLSLVTP